MRTGSPAHGNRGYGRRMEWDPETYLAEMLDEIPGYVELQETVVAAIDMPPTSILELGTGTGETATRILAAYPDARWTGIDSSEPMLARARERLPTPTLPAHAPRVRPPKGPFTSSAPVQPSNPPTPGSSATLSIAP